MTRIPAYVLSLGVPRNPKLVSDLEHLGFTVRLVEGIDGRQLSSAELSRVNQDKAVREIGRKLTPGEIGCHLGHQKIYAMACEARHDWVLVCEDDAVLDSELSGFDTILSEIRQSRRTVVTLYTPSHYPLRKSSIRISSVGTDRPIRIGRYFKPPSSSLSYFINKTALGAALKDGQQITSTADWPMWAYTCDFYGTIPLLSRLAEDTKSWIDSEGGKMTGTRWKVAPDQRQRTRLHYVRPSAVAYGSRRIGGVGRYARYVMLPQLAQQVRAPSRRLFGN